MPRHCGRSRIPCPQLLTVEYFRRWNDVRAFKKYWARVCHLAKIQDLHFHDLRHTFTTRLQGLGVDYETRQALLGLPVGGWLYSTAVSLPWRAANVRYSEDYRVFRNGPMALGQSVRSADCETDCGNSGSSQATLWAVQTRISCYFFHAIYPVQQGASAGVL